MKVIGVTGGVGAGKSEVLGYIAEHWNATVVEADEVGYLGHAGREKPATVPLLICLERKS